MAEDAAPGERIRPSATVLLVRKNPELEVYLAERSQKTRFFPGYHVFPGGTLDESDGADTHARRRAALRELFEETGVLAVKGDPSGFPREEARAAVDRGEHISPLLKKHGLSWDLEALVPAGRLLTPPFALVRYDTDFYVLDLPAGESPEVDGQELVSGRWFRPADALKRWVSEMFPLPPPTLAYLHLLEETGDAREAARMAHATDSRPHHERFHIELHPGVYVLPLRAPTLPPATTQNCYIFDGAKVVVVDPGTPHESERVALFHTLDKLVKNGRRVTVLLTHHHGDHVGSVAAVKSRYQARVLAHEATAIHLATGLVDEMIPDGYKVNLGEWNGAPWRLTAIHTPGHTPGHLAFRDERWGMQLVGDLVSGVSTILVPPGEGDMSDYMASLSRLAALKPPLVLAGHGPLLPGEAALTHTLSHRKMREEKVVGALTADARTLDELLSVVYEDTPQAAWKLARLSLESHLIKLARDGVATREGESWRLSASRRG